MKIAIPTSQFFPIKSGVASYIEDMVKILSDKYGYDITVYTLGFNVLKKEEFLNRIKIKRFPSFPLFKDYTINRKMISDIAKNNFDVIHSCHYGYSPALSGFIASVVKRMPHIITPVLHEPNSIFSGIKLYSYHLAQGLPSLWFSRYVIALSNHEKKMLCKLGVNPERIKVLPIPIDTEKFRRMNVRRSPSVKSRAVLFVAPLQRSKGADAAFEIAKSVISERDDTSFVFIGHGEFEKHFRAEAKKFPKKSFLFLDNLRLKELIYWYNLADVFLLPTRYEAFGKVLTESQACGTPVVSSRVGAVPEVVSDRRSGYLLEYGDWTGMKEKIVRLLDDGRRRRMMGREGEMFVRKKFALKDVVKKYVRIYEKCL